jgi:hypothetical protein
VSKWGSPSTATWWLPHFRVAFGAREQETMRATARKSPGSPFIGDTDTKLREATPLVRAAADKHLGELCCALEALRTRATP